MSGEPSKEQAPDKPVTTRRFWLEDVLVCVLVLIVIMIVVSLLPGDRLAHLRRAAVRPERAEVPVPAALLVGGVGPLSAGSWLDLEAVVPDAEGTPQSYTLTNLKVAAIVGDSSSVLLAVPPAVAPTLQAALLVGDTKFAYRLLPGTPTPAPTATPTPDNTPNATPTSAPEAGQSYLRLSTTDKLNLDASWLITGTAQLVVIEKLELPPLIVQGEGGVSPAAVSVHGVSTYTVEVVAFVDEDGGRQSAYDAKTAQVLIELAKNQWAEVARSLQGAETMWLIHVGSE